MKQDLNLNILKDELMDTIKLYHFNPTHVIFQYDNDPKLIAKSVKHWLFILKVPINHIMVDWILSSF